MTFAYIKHLHECCIDLSIRTLSLILMRILFWKATYCFLFVCFIQEKCRNLEAHMWDNILHSVAESSLLSNSSTTETEASY